MRPILLPNCFQEYIIQWIEIKKRIPLHDSDILLYLQEVWFIS